MSKHCDVIPVKVGGRHEDIRRAFAKRLDFVWSLQEVRDNDTSAVVPRVVAVILRVPTAQVRLRASGILFVD